MAKAKKKSAKKMNMAKFRGTVKRTAAHQKDWKKRIKAAIDNGEHGAAESAIKMLHKSKEAIHKLLDHVEKHHARKKPKA